MSAPGPLRSGGRGSFRLSLRIARRDAAAHRARSALIIMLIAIPIVGLTAVATIITSKIPTPQETIRQSLGSNEAKLIVVSSASAPIRQDPVDPGNWQVVGSGSPDAQGEPASPTAAPSAYLPQGTRVLSLRDLAVIAQTATGIGSISAVEGEPWDTAFTGRFAVLGGRAPHGSDEIMATPAALTRLGKSIGQQVTLTQPRAGTFTIVGTMRDLGDADSSEQLFGSPAAFDGVNASADLVRTSFYLPDRALSWSAVQNLNRHGIAVLSRHVVLNPPASDGQGLPTNSTLQGLQNLLILAPFIGFSLFEVALLAGAAFMVGTQQQQRSLATLASVGGDRRMLARVVSSAGVVLGLAGGVVGAIVGIAGGWAYLQLTANGSAAAFPGLHIDPLITTGIILLAVFAGWISALVPARRAARVDVVASLRGAARPIPPSRKAPIVGVITAVVGLVLTIMGAVLIAGYAASRHDLIVAQVALVLIVAGPILLQVAALVIAPAILRVVARWLGRVSTSARLASRDVARNSSRTAPAVGAIMSTIFIASFLFTYMAAAQAEQVADYEYHTARGLLTAQFAPDGPTPVQTSQLSRAMETTLHEPRVEVLNSAARPGQSPTETGSFPLPQLDSSARCTQLPAGPIPVKPGSLSILSPDCQGPGYLTFPTDRPHIWVATPEQIALAIGTPLSGASRAAYDAGRVVAFYPQYVRANAVTIQWWTAKQEADFTAPSGRGTAVRTLSLPAVVQQPTHAVYYDMVMSPTTARAAGILFEPSQIVAAPTATPANAQLDSLNATINAIGAGNAVTVYYESGPSTLATTAQWALLALSTIIAVGAASVAIGLARTEAQRDEAILGSLGAPPGLRRAFSSWTAVIITGVGSFGGVLLGTIPALAVSQSLVQAGGRAAVPFTPPWGILALAALGLPLVLALGAWIAAGRNRIRCNGRTPIG